MSLSSFFDDETVLVLHPVPGVAIHKAVRDAARLALDEMRTVSFEFNGRTMTIRPNTIINELCKQFVLPNTEEP